MVGLHFRIHGRRNTIGDAAPHPKGTAIFDLGWSLNNWSQDFMQLWENIYNDMMHQNKSDMRDLGKKITELSAYESQLIFLAFLLQLIIFIIIQFFEISSVIRREKK